MVIGTVRFNTREGEKFTKEEVDFLKGKVKEDLDTYFKEYDIVSDIRHVDYYFEVDVKLKELDELDEKYFSKKYENVSDNDKKCSQLWNDIKKMNETTLFNVSSYDIIAVEKGI